MHELLANWGPAILIVVSVTLTEALGVFYQTHHFDKRFDDLRKYIDVNVKGLEQRIDHLEHAVYRP